MTIAEKIYQHLVKMPVFKQKEVLDFVEYLDLKEKKHTTGKSGISWAAFSLANAMSGMEEEESPFTLNDIIIV